MTKFAYISYFSSSLLLLLSLSNPFKSISSSSRWLKFFFLISSFGYLLCSSVQSPSEENLIDNDDNNNIPDQELIPYTDVRPQCECHFAGISDPTNCYPPCWCKLNVEGKLCDQCKLGYFDLVSENPYGCRECFCFNATKKCHGIRWNTKPVAESDGWLITNDLNSHPVQPQVENGLPSIANDDAPEGIYFWLAPPKYLGCKLDAFDSVMMILLEVEKSRGDSSGRTLTHEFDIIMQGGPMNRKIGYKWSDVTWKFQRIRINHKVYLRNDGWYLIDPTGHPSTFSHPYQQVSKAEMASVLSDLKVLMIRAKFHTAQISCTLKKVDIMIADQPSDADNFLSVVREECEFPVNFKPPSCDGGHSECPPGYWKAKGQLHVNDSLSSNNCVKCQCNNHAISCDIGSGECFDCQHNTWGPHCDMCKPGFYGFPTKGTEYDCVKRCNCPFVDDYFDYPLCQATLDGDFICQRCPEHLTGPKCDKCVNGALTPPCLQSSSTSQTYPTTTTMSTIFTIDTTTSGPQCDVDPCIVKLREDAISMINMKDPFDLETRVKQCGIFTVRLIKLEQLIVKYSEEDKNFLEYLNRLIERVNRIESKWLRRNDVNIADVLKYSQIIELQRNETDYIVDQLKFMERKSIGDQEVKECVRIIAGIRRISSDFDLQTRQLSNLERFFSTSIDRMKSFMSKLSSIRSFEKRLVHLQLSIEDSELKADESTYQAIIVRNLTSNLYNEMRKIVKKIVKLDEEKNILKNLTNEIMIEQRSVQNIIFSIDQASQKIHQQMLRLPAYYQLWFDELNLQSKDSRELRQKINTCEQHVQRNFEKISQIVRIYQDKTDTSRKFQEIFVTDDLVRQAVLKLMNSSQEIQNKLKTVEIKLKNIKSKTKLDTRLIDKQIIELKRNLSPIQEMVNNRVLKLDNKLYKIKNKTEQFRRACIKLDIKMHRHKEISNLRRQFLFQLMDFINKTMDGCEKVKSRGERIKNSSTSFGPRIQALQSNSTRITQSVKRCFQGLNESQTKVFQAEKTIQSVSEKMEKFYQKKKETQNILNSIRENIARAHQRASELRFSLRSDGSNFCSRSFMVSKNSSYNNSISLTYSPPTEPIENTSLFYIASEQTGDYLALDMIDRQVRFSWNLGSGPGIVQHPQKLLPSIVPSKTEEKWYRIDVHREGQKAILSVGQVGNASSFLQVSSSSPGSSSELRLNSQDQVFIGSLPFDHKVGHSSGPYFAGCITDVYFDDEIINLWNFRTNSGCQGCYEGPEDSINSYYFDGKSSFSEQNSPSFGGGIGGGEDSNSLTFSIRTFQSYSLLSLCFDHKSGNFISISMDQGKVYLHLRFDGNPKHSLCTRRKLNDGQRVEISAEMFDRKVVLKINGQEEGSIDTEIVTSGLNICSTVYFGGVPLDITHSGQWPELPAVSFKGCMSDVQIDTTTLNLLNGRFYGVAAGCRGFDQRSVASAIPKSMDWSESSTQMLANRSMQHHINTTTTTAQQSEEIDDKYL
ncbi:laminin subunit alpha-1-like [Brevipalpus obovatus]|uniref:laminin subunit alpha-1-like n=1 Tax=Brevipalpus obovatus TaxID=246614 RepID=UPI003D9F8E12